MTCHLAFLFRPFFGVCISDCCCTYRITRITRIILVSIWTFSPCFPMDIDANDVPTQVSYQKGGGRGHNEEVDQFVLACKEPYNAESKLQFVFKF